MSGTDTENSTDDARSGRAGGVRTAIRHLSGWGNYRGAPCLTARPADADAVGRALDTAREANERNSITPRGLGRSYGDASIDPQGLVLLTQGVSRLLAIDNAPTDPGFDADIPTTLTAQAGVSLEAIINAALPRGCFLPVTPGTKFVTLGGALAADVHGKNHHAVGSIARFVESFTMLMADGSVARCSPDEHPDVFHATLGGMGLTGVILTATIRMLRVPSAYIRVRHERQRSLTDAMDALERTEPDTTYAVAWIDCLARGDAMGRSVLMLGEHAHAGELLGAQSAKPYDAPSKRVKTMPGLIPSWALNPLTVRAFNALYYRAHPDSTAITDYDSFFYPLDSVQHWNRVYGRRGFVQFQALLPKETARDGMRELLTRISDAGIGSFLAVLKTCGPASAGPLSYLYPGFTLALDLPNTGKKLDRLMRECNAVLLDHGGRIYAAKDAVTDAQTFAKMYPRLDEFRALKARIDPHTRFDSALARRLGITSNRAQGAA